MTARQQLITVICVLALALAGWTVLKMTLGHEISPLGIGSKAPTFQAAKLDSTSSNPASLKDYSGDVVLLNIWATWCAPCRAEMPSMQQLQDAYADKGFKVVAVSIDDEHSTGNIREFVKSYGLTFDILHDPAGDIQRIYQTTGVPESIVIAKDGTIRNKIAGAVDWYSDANRALIERLLAE